mgnify:CR=1 FL=1
MRNFYLTVFAIFAAFPAIAQQIAVKSVGLVNERVLANGFYPHFSKDGGLLFFTTENYQGLKAYDFSSQKIQVLSEDKGAGYGFFQGIDSTKVYYNKTEFVNQRKKNSICTYNLATNTSEQLTRAVRGASLLKSVSTTIKTDIGAIVYIDNQQIVYKEGTQKTILSPNGEQNSYLWPVISPDGKKIVYVVAGKGAFICDIDGKNIVSLGYLHAPQWINNQWIVGMEDYDDGQNVTSSEIVAVTVDGLTRQNLTNTSDEKEMYPTVSPTRDKIVFNSYEGKLYMMDVVVE